MKKPDLSSNPWEKKTVAQTVDMYKEWANSYDADVVSAGYLTPLRCAQALANYVDLDAEILDFGCGTGLGGQALKKVGFSRFDGCDVTAEMLDLAKSKHIYRQVWQATPDRIDLGSIAYDGIIAAGVISRGAAPAETLDALLFEMPPNSYLSLSYNDYTLRDNEYMDALKRVQDQRLARLISRENGPHLPAKNMGSDVIVLQRQ